MSASAETLRKPGGSVRDGSADAPHDPPIPGFKPRAEDALAHALARIPTGRLLIVAGATSAVIYGLLVAAFPITRWWNHPHLANSPDAINDMGQIRITVRSQPSRSCWRYWRSSGASS